MACRQLLADSSPSEDEILEAIRKVAKELGHPPSKREFARITGIREFCVMKHFPSWTEAVRAAGVVYEPTNVRLDDERLLMDWGEMVRRHRRIPTRVQYRHGGTYSPGTFEKHFGPWSNIPESFRRLLGDSAKWQDVLNILPPSRSARRQPQTTTSIAAVAPATVPKSSHLPASRHEKRSGATTYGNPIDFRGLRHEPVNEQGVVFLFGMVARELGYMVENMQTGFPDCEAKRQVSPNRWQRVRIEFEFESRHFRDHGHLEDGCDVIVCWRHNWPECPQSMEVVELSTMIRTLGKSDD